MLKICSPAMYTPLKIIYEFSFENRALPENWKKANAHCLCSMLISASKTQMN